MNPIGPNDPLRTTDDGPAPAPAPSPPTLTADARPAPDDASEPPLPSIPGYEVLGVLGRGGMGVVYKARHMGLNRVVALKMVLAGGHAGPDELARFRGEAEAVARLKHPNVVQVYDVGESGGLPYFSLEFVEGGSLDRKLAGTPLPPNEAAALVEVLARAVAVAHAAGLIHRDLKPANVLLTPDGTPKVTDFGLAKRLDSAGPTASGAVMGTPSYMAPEQAGGKSKDIGPACDVYALGAILYECLTGRPPFKAATPLDTILQVVGAEPVPPRQLNVRVPVDLETVCLKCLQKGPDKRYESAAALADDLTRFLKGEPILARPVGRLERAGKWVKRNPVVTAAAAAVVLALALGATVSYWKYLDAEEQKGIALQEAEKAKKARDFLVSIFELSDARGPRGAMTARQILDDAEKRIPNEFVDQPELQTELQTAIDVVYAKITRNAPLAMILEVRGAVQLHPHRDASRQPVPQDLLYAGDRLSLGADGQLRLVVLSDLHQEWLRPGREATVRRKGCEPADVIEERSDDVVMTFVPLQKGSFYMGWNGESGSARETKIEEDFEIAVHDVTQGQWQSVMGKNPSYFSRVGVGQKDIKDISDEELKLFPVEQVSWQDAQEFITKLNERQPVRRWTYRLPEEREWEYACRNGATSKEECSYHFYFDKPTNDLSSEQANFNGEDPFGKAPRGKFLRRTSRVGAYPPNKLGLCDMHGNVRQWCDDSVEMGAGRVTMGGCWYFPGSMCWAGYPGKIEPTFRNETHGFRLVRVPVR
jgi:formylglycine-generating enzyme required for sulfatase activity